MARTIKKGLDYFPFDVDFFQDIRIRKLVKYQGGKAITVYALLLCIIYRNGYYAEWDKELPFILSEQSGYTEAYIQEVIDCCMNIGLFSKELFESAKVLTSRGIQERYARICSATRRNGRIDEHCLMRNASAVPAERNDAYASGERRGRPEKSKPKTGPLPKPEPSHEHQSGQAPHREPCEGAVQNPADPTKLPSTPVPLSESVQMLKKDEKWIGSVGIRYSRNPDDIRRRLDDFALVCSKDSHSSLQDCRSHFCRWLAKQKTATNQETPEGAVPKKKSRADSTKEYLDELDRHAAKACTPDEYIRSKGYDPQHVTMSNLRDEIWLAQNPPTHKPTI